MFKHIFFNSNLIWSRASLRQSLDCGSNQKKMSGCWRKGHPTRHCACVLKRFVFVFTVSVIKACIDIINRRFGNFINKTAAKLLIGHVFSFCF